MRSPHLRPSIITTPRIRAFLSRGGLGLVLPLLAGSFACQDPNYRVVTAPSGEGGVNFHTVPVERRPAPPAAPVSTEPAKPVDSDLATIESLWPQVSPADRQTVTDLVKRLAK